MVLKVKVFLEISMIQILLVYLMGLFLILMMKPVVTLSIMQKV